MAQVPRRLRDRTTILTFGLVVAALLVACGSSATPSPSAAASGANALNGTWVLTSYTSPGGTQATVPAAITPSLQLDGNAARGFAGCNTFTAIAVVNGQMIHFDQVAATKVACPEPGPTIEAAFLQALNLATQWNVTGNTLTMNAPGTGPTSLTFIRGS